MLRKSYFSIILLIALFFSCKDKTKGESNNENVVQKDFTEICFNSYFGNGKLYKDSVYTFSNGIQIKISDLKFYITELKFGENLFSEAFLYNLSSNNISIKSEVNYKNVSQLAGYLGVNSKNHNDPTLPSTESPLNIMNADGMFWGWSDGYIFLAIEGKADTLVDQSENFDLNFVYHVGKDVNLKTLTFNNLNWSKVTENFYRTNLKIDIEKIFENNLNPIDIKTERMTHSGFGDEVLSNKVISNFVTSISNQ